MEQALSIALTWLHLAPAQAQEQAQAVALLFSCVCSFSEFNWTLYRIFSHIVRDFCALLRRNQCSTIYQIVLKPKANAKSAIRSWICCWPQRTVMAMLHCLAPAAERHTKWPIIYGRPPTPTPSPSPSPPPTPVAIPTPEQTLMHTWHVAIALELCESGGGVGGGATNV